MYYMCSTCTSSQPAWSSSWPKLTYNSDVAGMASWQHPSSILVVFMQHPCSMILVASWLASSAPTSGYSSIHSPLEQICPGQPARALQKVLISLEPWHTHLLRVLGAVRIALERAEVKRLIPWMSIQHAKEGCADSKHAEDLPLHLTCTWNMLMVPGAEIHMLPRSREKSPQVSNAKSLCTHEFAVCSACWSTQLIINTAIHGIVQDVPNFVK